MDNNQIKELSPKGSESPDYYIIGYNSSDDEVMNNNPFDPNSSKSNSFLSGILGSIGINEMNCRFNKVIRSSIDYHSIDEDTKNSYINDLIEDIYKTNPKIIIGLGSDVGSILLKEQFRYITRSRGRFYNISIKDKEYKCLVTYSPSYITKEYKPNDPTDMSDASDQFLNDIQYCKKYIEGELVDISDKDLKFAMTYDEFKKFHDEQLLNSELPAYDIESNAKDPRCADFKIIGFSMAPNGNTGMYVIRKTLEYEMPHEDWNKCVELAKEFIMSHRILVHNIMYEKPATYSEWGINIIDFEDTLVKARELLGGATGAGLKEQCILNLGYPEWDADLGEYMTDFDTLRYGLAPTSAGNPRWDFKYLQENGFVKLYELYNEYLGVINTIEDKYSEQYFQYVEDHKLELGKSYDSYRDRKTYNIDKLKDLITLSDDDQKLLDEYYLDRRSRGNGYAVLDLIPLIELYYNDKDECNHILELIGKEIINYVEVEYSGVMSYASIPMKILTKYGAMDSVGTQDLNDFLSKRLTNESTSTVNLWNGYRIMKQHFLIGAHLEMNGLYWDENVAKSNREWLSTTAKESLQKVLLSGYLDDLLIERGTYLLNDYVKENMMDYVKEVLGEFDMQASGIKLHSTNKRISYKNLVWELPKEFIDSKKDWILNTVKSEIMDPEKYPTFESLKYYFNPGSNKDTKILDKILVTQDIQMGYIVAKIQEQLESEEFDIDSIPHPDRIIFDNLRKINAYNKKAKEDKSIPPVSKKTICKKVEAMIEQIGSFNPKGVIYKLIDEAVHYHLSGASEPVILELFNYYEALGIDTEDESTWSNEFKFLYDFRMYKKCTKLISSYIDGSKIGRGSVWVVNREDIDNNKMIPTRQRKYDWYHDKSENEEYIMQPKWKVCFTGDTKVKSLDGNSYSFKELVDNNTDKLWVYSCRTDGQIVPALATNIRKTRTNSNIIKVTLDNGEVIKCTPDHPFMLRDGSYKNAKDLSMDDSLMPLYLEYDKDGYVLYVDNTSGKLCKVHSLVNRVINKKEYDRLNESHNHYHEYLITHHKDFIKTNNVPDNLQWMTNKEHSSYHASSYELGLGKFNSKDRPESWRINNRAHLDKYNKSEEHAELSRYNIQKWKDDNPELNANNGRRNITAYNKSEDHHERCRIISSRPEHIALLKENSKKYRQTEEFIEHCKSNAERYLNTPENREKASERFSNMNSDPDKRILQSKGKIGKVIKYLIENGLEFNESNYESNKQNRGIKYRNITNYFNTYEEAYQYGSTYNHKIVSIEYLDYTEDVYDMTVDEYHNFALDAGVFVHNCTAETLRWQSGIHTLTAGRTVKGMYTSRYKGGVIAAPDYSQLEVRITAGLSHCTPMLEAYKNGEDVHLRTAMGIFKKPADQITKVERRFSKMGTFRILYGSTPEGFASQFLDGDVTTARQIFNGFYETYPEIKNWMDKRHKEVEATGRVSCENIGYFINIDRNGPEGMEGAYRKAGNYPVQSQGSMTAGYVLATINQYLMDHNMYTKPICFIHDSLEFDIHPKELFKVIPTVDHLMNTIPIEEFGIPTKADVTIGTSMGMENEVKELNISDDGNSADITLEGFEDDLDEMYEHWKNNAKYRVINYEDIGEREEVYTRRRELFQEKLALGPFLGKTRYLINRKFHIEIE